MDNNSKSDFEGTRSDIIQDGGYVTTTSLSENSREI